MYPAFPFPDNPEFGREIEGAKAVGGVGYLALGSTSGFGEAEYDCREGKSADCDCVCLLVGVCASSVPAIASSCGSPL